MQNKSKNDTPVINKNTLTLPVTIINEMVGLCSTEQWNELEIKACYVVKKYPGQILAWKVMYKALLKLGKWQQAMEALLHVTNLWHGDADVYNDLGFVFYNLGRMVDAEENYRQALKLDPRFAAAHFNLGTLLAEHGRFAEAVENLQQSLEINPDAAGTHSSLGGVLRDSGRPNEAEACCLRALEINPNFFEAYINLGLVLNDLGRFEESQVSYRLALEIEPNSDFALCCLGSVIYHVGGKDDEAKVFLERAIELNPNNAEAYKDLGNILLRAGHVSESMVMYRRAQELCPLRTFNTRKEKADFSVVLLDSPGPGCTPVDYLISKSSYDCHFYCMLPGTPLNLDILRAKADVIINMIADADSGKDILPFAQDLVERLDRPTVNHPSLIMNTNRETVARRLDGIPLCRIPRTRRLAGSVLAAAAENNVLDGFSMPLLARLAGNHGGDDFEKFDDIHAVAEFVSKRPEADFYVIEYVDYRSADGFFRKYRLISIDGELLPYHLAIHDDWKVHHFRTDMANQAWMRREEEGFLKTPHMVFDEPHQEALRAVAAATGLDYCGIDCALDCNGDIVVFEANAAMLVHDEKNELFAYKNPYIVRIKDSFNAMLTRLAMRV